MPRSTRISYHWVVFAAAFVVLLGAAGTRSAPSVLMDPLRDEFGWSRATVGFAVSINVLLYGFIGPFAAALRLLEMGLVDVAPLVTAHYRLAEAQEAFQHAARPGTLKVLVHP